MAARQAAARRGAARNQRVERNVDRDRSPVRGAFQAERPASRRRIPVQARRGESERGGAVIETDNDRDEIRRPSHYRRILQNGIKIL